MIRWRPARWSIPRCGCSTSCAVSTRSASSGSCCAALSSAVMPPSGDRGHCSTRRCATMVCRRSACVVCAFAWANIHRTMHAIVPAWRPTWMPSARGSTNCPHRTRPAPGPAIFTACCSAPGGRVTRRWTATSISSTSVSSARSASSPRSARCGAGCVSATPWHCCVGSPRRPCSNRNRRPRPSRSSARSRPPGCASTRSGCSTCTTRPGHPHRTRTRCCRAACSASWACRMPRRNGNWRSPRA